MNRGENPMMNFAIPFPQKRQKKNQQNKDEFSARSFEYCKSRKRFEYFEDPDCEWKNAGHVLLCIVYFFFFFGFFFLGPEDKLFF